MIPPETIQTIFETARIEEVVGDFVTLKKRGANMLGLCPFHNEKTPSFTVSPAKGIYKCFGCGEGGNSVNFIMNLEHYSYPEALKYLARKYSIEIEEEETTPEQQEALNERESQFVVSAFAEEFFVKQLHDTDEGKAIGLSYFKERGFTQETIEKFKLGYSPDKWDVFAKSAKDAGYKSEYLLKTGLLKERNGQEYDGYRGRVIFPIHNLSGRPIGFGGRTLKTDKKVPKYVNSPECDIYNKRKVLYGLYFAKSTVVKEDNCLLVEGYTDVISLAQAGITNVVSSSGTSLTTDQIKLINRYTKNITILYDGDPAGIKASFRGIDLILEEGMQVKVVLFPEGEDPDSFAKSHHVDETKEFIATQAKDFIVFKTDLLMAETRNDPIKKTALIHDIVNSIALIPDFIARSVYLKECSSLLDVPEAALIAELNKVRGKNAQKTQKAQQQTAKKNPQSSSSSVPPPGFPDEPPPDFFGEPGQPPYTPPEPKKTGPDMDVFERDIVRLLLHYGDHTVNISIKNEHDNNEWVNLLVADYLINELQMDEMKLENPQFQLILEEFENLRTNEKVWNQQHFTNHINPEISSVAVDLLSTQYELHNWEAHEIYVEGEDRKMYKGLRGAIYRFKKARIVRTRLENQLAIKQAQDRGEDFMELLSYDIVLSEIEKRFTIK